MFFLQRLSDQQHDAPSGIVRHLIFNMMKGRYEITYKEKIHAVLSAMIAEKIMRLQQTIADLRAGIEAETKSSAGDKYETSRAMLHADIDHVNRQLNNMLQQQAILKMQDTDHSAKIIGPGSIAETSKGIFYMSIAGGKISVGGTEVIALSASSPLGQALCGLKENETAMFNGRSYIVKRAY